MRRLQQHYPSLFLSAPTPHLGIAGTPNHFRLGADRRNKFSIALDVLPPFESLRLHAPTLALFWRARFKIDTSSLGQQYVSLRGTHVPRRHVLRYWTGAEKVSQ